jgi:hypothetical protein
MTGSKCAIIYYTIHSLILRQVSNDPFSIEWTLENNFHSTGNIYSSGDQDINFENHGRLKTAFSFDTKRNMMKDKIMKFSVYQYKNESKRIYGEFQINLSEYFHKKEFTKIGCILNSPFDEPSFCTISILIKKIERHSSSEYETEISSFGEMNNELTELKDIPPKITAQ